MSLVRSFLQLSSLSLLWFCCAAFSSMKHHDQGQFDRKQALAISRAAIGQPLGNYQLQDRAGNTVRLSEFQGKPLVISMIYTSCFHICPTTTKHLAEVVGKARDVLGDDSFNVVTVGFDSINDSPPRMANFAREQGVDMSHWYFLSTDGRTVDQLASNLGFQFEPSPQGFNHLIQTTLIDANGLVYRQIYGMEFSLPLLVDPLRDLVYSRESSSFVDSVSDQIHLFCTVYDPAGDRYKFDYSIFIGTLIGICSVIVLGLQLIKEWRLTLNR